MRKLAIPVMALLLVLSGCSLAPPSEQGSTDGTPSRSEETIIPTDGRSSGAEATDIPTDDFESALPTRRSLSRDFVQIGEITRETSDRSDEMKNESALQWYRRTFRNTADSGGPLLITLGIKHYATTASAKNAVETTTDDSTDSEQNIQEVTVRDEWTITQISSQNKAGNYVSTALYREESVVFKVQAIDPKRDYANQAQTLLSKMVVSVSSQS